MVPIASRERAFNALWPFEAASFFSLSVPRAVKIPPYFSLSVSRAFQISLLERSTALGRRSRRSLIIRRDDGRALDAQRKKCTTLTDLRTLDGDFSRLRTGQGRPPKKSARRLTCKRRCPRVIDVRSPATGC